MEPKNDDVEAPKGSYRPFEDTDTKVPRVMSFEQEGGNGTKSQNEDSVVLCFFPLDFASYANPPTDNSTISLAPQIILKSNPSGSNSMDKTGWWCSSFSKLHKKELVQLCYLSAAAITGALLRIMLAQLFGEECKNPGTVGWLKASSPLCVTAEGHAEHVGGGVIFADLPANLLGCFFMGLMQDGKTLGLAIPVPVAWLSPLSDFQSMTLIHFAIKTGFCGSLTTFSSWNSEMIVLMFGSGYNRSSQFMKAIFGYLVGMETALGSYVFGTTVAKWLHRFVNPELAAEADAMRERQREGVFINRELPETERRFLHKLNMQYDSVLAGNDAMSSLLRWRTSTQDARRVNHHLVDALYQIEISVFCDHAKIPPDAESVARQEGWDVDALLEWTNRRRFTRLPRTSSAGFLLPYEHNKWASVAIPGFFVASVVLMLILGVIKFSEDDDYLNTYRTMVYSLLFAPFGAFLRWQLSSLNGSFALTSELAWIPAGTLAANVLGSMLSVTMTGLEFRNTAMQNFWVVGTLRAMRVGFCGCLTTVSTFVAEVHSFFDQQKHDRGYIYILITLTTCCTIAAAIYAGIKSF
jgi:fluoride ion exporter CrcB/FEX